MENFMFCAVNYNAYYCQNISLLFLILSNVSGEPHIEFRAQCVTRELAGKRLMTFLKWEKLLNFKVHELIII